MLSAPGVFCLYPLPGLSVEDRLMTVLIIKPGQYTVIFHLFLGERIGYVAFLPAKIACVDLVLDQLGDCSLLKQLAKNRPVSLCVQLVADCPQGISLQKKCEHLPDDLCLLGDNDVLLQVVIVAVAEDMLVGCAYGAVLKTLADTPFAVFGNGSAFLLGKGREQGDHQLSALVKRVDAFLFEAYLDSQSLEAAYCFQGVYCVAGKARQALGQDDVDLPGLACCKHFLKLIAGGGLCAADASVRKHARIFPARRILYECAVIADLLIQ